MECCRMSFVLGAWIVCLLSAAAVPDNSLREQKLQNLINSLGLYSAEEHSKGSTVKNVPKAPDLYTAVPETTKVPDQRSRALPSPTDGHTLTDDSSIESYEDFYRIYYGTPEGVNLLRNKYGPNGLQKARMKFSGVNKEMNEVSMAIQHFSRIRKQGTCEVPRAQLVRVQDLHPDPSREYKPRCTLLHRCGERSGCCDSDAFYCAPAAIQEVALYFYFLPVGKVNGRRVTVQRLLFENHTSCECQPVNDLPRMQQAPTLLDRVEPKSRCGECPVPFSRRMYTDGRCGCDCFDKQRPCLRIKRGRDPLQPIERRCVESHHCHIPDCEHGEYDSTTGYCPRRHDEKPAHHRRPHDGHRWTFHERD